MIGLLQRRSTDQAVRIQPGCGAGAPNGGDALPLPVGQPKQEEETAEEEEQRAMEENRGKVGSDGSRLSRRPILLRQTGECVLLSTEQLIRVIVHTF